MQRSALLLTHRGLAALSASSSSQIVGQSVAASALQGPSFQAGPQAGPQAGCVVRGFAAGAAHPPAAPVATGPKTPLQLIVPQALALVPNLLSFAYGAGKGLLYGIATSGQIKSLVTNLGNRVVVAERMLDLKDLDLVVWSSWLAAAGYTDRAGWKKICAAMAPKVDAMSHGEVASVVESLGSVDYYDKDLFSSLATAVSSKFTEFDTEALLKMAAVFSGFGHHSVELFDDIADGIAYCNHYLAPLYVPLPLLAGAFAAFAKHSQDRTDAFVVLSRAINEDKLMALEGRACPTTVVSLLHSFDALDFWPECTEALFVVADARPQDFTEEERKLVESLVAKVEAQAPGGKLKYYREGATDPGHYHGPEFGDFNLWAFRDALVPKYYSPSAVKAM